MSSIKADISSNRWQRPSGVIKLKVKKRRTLETCAVAKCNVLKPLNSKICKNQDGRVPAVKRRNPFACSPRKKPSLQRDTKSQENKLFRALDDKQREGNVSLIPEISENLEPQSRKEIRYFPPSGPRDGSSQSEVQHSVDNSLGLEKTESEPSPYVEQGKLTFPVDWSLKTKVRFTSTLPFSWSSSLKSSESAEGISSFVRCHDKRIPLHEFEQPGECFDIARTALFQTSKVWMHPSLPWLKLFPRINQERKLGESNKTNFKIFLDAELSSSLQADWVGSFHSVFNLVRCGHCPFFYLCANYSTMLFRAAGVTRDTEVNVVITPTTKGFRESLRKEGIEFTLPHAHKNSTGDPNSSVAESESDLEEEKEENSEDNSGDEQDWLESMGLQKEQFPTFEPHKLSNNQNAKIRNTDQHPNSTVLVRGGDTQALFNFILNWRSITAKNGKLAGVPPTLVAPVAFEGATLRSFKVTQGVVKHQQAKGMQQLFSLEVTGPLLPGCVHDICTILKTTQMEQFTAMFMQYQPSVALNIPLSSTDECHSSANSKCGLSLELVEYFHQAQEIEKVCLKELSCKDGLYTWKSAS